MAIVVVAVAAIEGIVIDVILLVESLLIVALAVAVVLSLHLAGMRLSLIWLSESSSSEVPISTPDSTIRLRRVSLSL